jgi:hypothetical protein
MSGGCQCGAVRFRVAGPPRHTSLCHCRMCQKQFAAPFGAFGSWPVGEVAWTRGSRKVFASSDAIARGFCGACGTPLTYEPIREGKHIAVALCAFDDPAAWPPQLEIGLESRLGWLEGINALARLTPAQQAERASKYPPPVSRQHPDHDTAVWPPEESAA